MNWARKGLLHFLSLVLLLSLLGTAFSTSANLAFSHPDKVETWLNQSGFYDHFVSNAIDQAKKAAGSSEQQGSVTLSDTAVQQAAESSFSTALVQKSVKTFLDANYAWLEGKTPQPSFTIDLSNAKQGLASQVGQYVQAHINSLPVCTAQQLAALGSSVSSIDPLNITCRPPQLSAQAEAALVTQRIQNTDTFLANPVISPNNINPNGGSQSQPYYQKYSSLPKLYQLGVKLPYIYASVALLSALAILFLAARKRFGLRRIGWMLAAAGLFLTLIKFIGDAMLSQAQKHIFNNANVGQLQQALTDFLHRAEHQLVKVDLLFGLAFLALALVVLVVLKVTKNRGAKPSTPETPSGNSGTPNHSEPTAAQPQEPPRPTPTGPPLPPKRPPRLVQ